MPPGTALVWFLSQTVGDELADFPSARRNLQLVLPTGIRQQFEDIVIDSRRRGWGENLLTKVGVGCHLNRLQRVVDGELLKMCR